MGQTTRIAYELEKFSNVNYAIGMKFFSLSEMFHHITILNAINKGWKMAQYFTPEINQEEFPNEVYLRLVYSFTELNFFDRMITENVKKFAPAESILEYDN